MSLSLVLRIVLTLAGVGALSPFYATAQDAARQMTEKAEAVMEVATLPASSFVARRYPVVFSKTAWTCIGRIRRTYQQCFHSLVVFVGGAHPRLVRQSLNFEPASYAGTFSSESPFASIRRRGPPFFSPA